MEKGDKFNKLTAVKFIKRDKHFNQYWLFRCDCGTEKVIRYWSVRSGLVKACGCLLKKHGMTNTKTYNSWIAMKKRCLDKNHISYKNYGGRGIIICSEWLKFENFYSDMGKRPKNKSLDRVDNNGNYCKDNCRWATKKQQMNNMRTNI